MPGHVFLEGERTTLRTVERTDADLEVLGRVRNDPSFRRSLGFDAPWSRDRVDAFVESVADDESSHNLLVCLEDAASPGGSAGAAGERADEPTVVGAVALFDVDRVRGTLSYWLLEPYRGEGYASEAVSLVVDHAVDDLGLHRVEADVFAGNDPSTRLLERLGFVREGTARERRFAGGEFRDVHRYAVLEDEWRRRREEDSA